MDAAPVKQGDILAGKYRVERVLGVGGMGVVVAATHLELLEPVALKFMLPSALESADSVERFLREARAAARLKNEHVARVHDVGRLENGAPYLVMEYLEGLDLDALVKRQGPLPPAIAALYAIQVCEALAEAHSLGIVHRDLKPSNLFLIRKLDGSACVKVLDFGISKVVGPEGELDMTKSETVLGSPSYMSPEQMRSARSVDARSDIWSLGIILYKLATGKLPFRAQNITELITMVLEAAPEPPSTLRGEVGPALDAVILRCLKRSRDERYPHVAALAAALAPLGPPGAGAAVESMHRILAASRVSGSFASDSHLASAPPRAPGGFTAEGRTPAGTSGAPPPTPLPTSAPGRGGEPTRSSWEENPRTRPRARSWAPFVLAGLGGVAAFATASGVLVLRRSLQASSAAGSGSSAAATIVVPATEASGAPAPPSVLSAAQASVVPPPSSASASSVRPSGVRPPSRVSSEKPAASGRAVPNPAPDEAPEPSWSKPGASDIVDPFGNGRK
jgi:serine/threonine protein kinase